MANEIKLVRILLASPGNLSADRKIVREVVETINRDSGRRSGFHAEVVGWETHSPPAAGEYAQAVINDQFPKDIDIFLGLLGSYFGTPTKTHASGTEEEFHVAYDAWSKNKSPEIMFYFSNQSSGLRDIDPDQLKLVKDFKKTITGKGVYYFEYENELGLRLDLHPHISQAIHEALNRSTITTVAAGSISQEFDIFPHLNQLFSDDPLVASDDLFRQASNALASHTDLQEQMTKHAADLSQATAKALKILTDTNKSQLQIQFAANKFVSDLGRYQLGIRRIIPLKKKALIEAMTSVQRAVSIIQENDLLQLRPLGDLQSSVAGAIESFNALLPIFSSTSEAFKEWPDDATDLTTQKKIIMALHDDLKTYYEGAVVMLTQFAASMLK